MAARKTVKIEPAEPTSTCKSCRHGWLYETEDSAQWYCRRFPPTVTYDYEEGCPVSSFPCVAPDLVCGEFAAQLNS